MGGPLPKFENDNCKGGMKMGEVINKKVKAKVVHKYELEKDWNNSSYIPQIGEVVFYAPETNEHGEPDFTKVPENETREPIIYTRQKNGDGVNKVKDLPFSALQADWKQTDETSKAYILNKPSINEDENKNIIEGNTNSITAGSYDLTYFISEFVLGLNYDIVYDHTSHGRQVYYYPENSIPLGNKTGGNEYPWVSVPASIEVRVEPDDGDPYNTILRFYEEEIELDWEYDDYIYAQYCQLDDNSWYI
jgi:hypothetical protein